MIRRILIGVIALLIIAGGVFAGVYYWKKSQGGETTASAPGETQVALVEETTPEVPETTGLDEELAPETPGAEGEIAPETTQANPPLGEEIAPDGEDTAPQPEVDLPVEGDASADVPSVRGLDVPAGASRTEERPVADSEPVAAVGVDAVAVDVVAAPVEEGSSGVTSVVPVEHTPTPAPIKTPTPIPTTPVVTPMPPQPTGNYAVSSMSPIAKAQLAEIRRAMQPLGVTLREQKIGEQPVPAYRVAVGYFRAKEEATSWAITYLRPKGFKYYVYPVQGMYSIQVGVYSQQQNAEMVMRDLYQSFPGWRLPVRLEPMSLAQSFYQVSLRGIPENLGRQIQDRLLRMGIQAELTRIR